MARPLPDTPAMPLNIHVEPVGHMSKPTSPSRAWGLKTGVGKRRRRNDVDAGLIEERGVIGPAGIDAGEADRVVASRHVERVSGIVSVADAGRGEGAHRAAVDHHLDLSWRPPRVVAPLRAAAAIRYDPAAAAGKFTTWLIEPVFWRKATWLPCGALGLPLVKAVVPLPDTPAVPLKLHGEPAGSISEGRGTRPQVRALKSGSETARHQGVADVDLIDERACSRPRWDRCRRR